MVIEAETYDRFVAWHAEALRRHQLHLDEAQRLKHLFDTCAAYGAGGCFICRAVDARGYHSRLERRC